MFLEQNYLLFNPTPCNFAGRMKTKTINSNMEQSLEPIRNKIHEIRGQRVMLDRDLAELYGVETRALNQAVRRNIERFPEDFMFQLSKGEMEILKSQIVISSWGGTRKLPYAFTSSRTWRIHLPTRTTSTSRPVRNWMPSARHWRSCSPGNRSHADVSDLYKRNNYLKE